MKISFHGAARTVTGSKHLITLTNGNKYLLDCGMFQGLASRTDPMNRDWGFEPEEVTHMILSHAHIDHSGLIPKLIKDGFKGKIYCTPATEQLANILLEDSAEIQEEDIKHANKTRSVQGRAYLSPLYNVEDAKIASNHFRSKEYNTWFAVDDHVQAMFTDAGHIIGSAAVHLRITENGKTTCITFSGDIGRYRDAILRSPDVFPQADYIIIESTYGDKLHDNIRPTPDSLLEWIERICIKQKGKLILPSFSVGRTQEILYCLNQLELENRLPAIDYYVDSPLSIEATMVVKSYPEYFNKSIQKIMQSDKDPFTFKGLTYVKSVEQSKSLNFRKEPCVIISASGMADAGRVKHHISNCIESTRNAIVLMGYCEPNSLGGRLMSGKKEVTIFGVPHEVNATIGVIKSMSAHGDYEDLCQFLACQDASQVRKVFIVHGEYEVQEEFKNRLLRKGFTDVVVPDMHEVMGLG